MKAPSTALRTTAGFLAVLAGALALRIAFIESNLDRDWPYSIFFYGDSRHFHLYAVQLVRGELYDQGIPFHPPLYAWFLAAIYEALGVPEGSAVPYKACMAALNALTVALAWLWWHRALGWRWALTGAAWLGLSFGWLVLSATFGSEVLYAFLLTATLALAWLRAGRLSWLDSAALGALMGAGALTRGEHLSLWPFLALYLALGRDPRRSWRELAARVGLALGVTLLVLAPWTVRNHRVLVEHNRSTSSLEPLSTFAPVTAYGPINFALANHDRADGGFGTSFVEGLGGAGMLDLRNPVHRRHFIHGYADGWRWILSNPGGFARLAAAKLGRWLDGLCLGFGVSNWPGGLEGARAPVDIFVPRRCALAWPLAGLLVLGLALSCLRPYREFSICSLVVLHRLIVTVAFFGYARGMVVLLPALVPLMLLPAIAVRRRFPHVERAAAGLAAAACCAFLIHALAVSWRGPRDYVATGTVDAATGKMIQSDRVEIRPK